MAQIKINNIIYGSSNASDIIYKNITVEEKLNSIPVFDPSDNANIEDAKYDYLTYGHIINHLNSNDTDKALSANQGKVLSEKINNVEMTNNKAITALDNKITNNINDINNKLSHIGMIIHSTTLDTMQKVIEIYGGKTWVKIEGRFLLGQSNNYAINSTGGEKEHTLTVSEMPSHMHHQCAMAYGYSGWGEYTTPTYCVMINYGGDNYFGPNATKNATSVDMNVDTNGAGWSYPHNNMPPYKTVYIWERTE